MPAINPKVHSVSAFAPATSANLAVGFDILGLAFGAIGDRVTLKIRDDHQFVIEAIQAQEQLPFENDKNTAAVAVQALCQDLSLDCGFSIEIQKGIPLSSGLGGSAASAVAALTACNAFLDETLPPEELIPYALQGEQTASGQKHGDNIVPCIFGGLTLIKNLDPIEIVQLPLPDIHCVLLHPHLQVSTRQARKMLKKELPLADYIKQSAHLAGFIASLYQNDLRLLQNSFKDFLIEPQRAALVPGFQSAQQAGLEAGALGVTLSGSGPTILALAKSTLEAKSIAEAMQAALKIENLATDYWLGPISKEGARIIEVK